TLVWQSPGSSGQPKQARFFHKRRKKRELFYYSILKIRGIATPVCALARNDMLLFGFAMTASFSARQIPICRAEVFGLSGFPAKGII
ncbi:MAG: hypothetical protein PUH36_04560, partial [Subdoligranulum sp.]|nr:hypothetical protein [Subdoligranulum sp.]